MVRTRKTTGLVAAGVETSPDTAAEVDSLRRGLEILRLFDARHRSLGLAEISDKLCLSRITTAKLVSTLVAHNFLRSNRPDRFEPHVAALSLGRAVKSGLGVVRTAQPRMSQLAERFGVHVLLATRDRLQMLVVENRLPHNKALLGLGMGARFPIATSASGRAYLWAQPENVRSRLLAALQAQEKETSFRRISDIYAAFQELEERGWCFLSAPVTNQTSAIATPLIVGGKTYALAAMTVGDAGMENKLRQDIAPELMAAARAFVADARSDCSSHQLWR